METLMIIRIKVHRKIRLECQLPLWLRANIQIKVVTSLTLEYS